MIYAEVLYNNACRQATPSYSGTEASGFEVINAFDWRDFSYFRPSAGTTTLDVTLTADTAVDRAVLWAAPAPGATAASIALQYESAPATFTTLKTWSSPTTGILWASFNQVTVLAGRKLRWVFTTIAGSFDLRQLAAGPGLTFAMGQWAGVAPPALTSGVVVENIIAVNGSILARNVRRTEKKGEIKLNYLTETWVRNSWDPFAIHAARYPFFWLWNPAKTQDAALAAAESIEAPVNDPPAPLMSVTMPIRVLT